MLYHVISLILTLYLPAIKEKHVNISCWLCWRWSWTWFQKSLIFGISAKFWSQPRGSKMVKIAKNRTIAFPWALKNEFWSKSNDFLLWLMILSHMLQFWDPYYGGAEGGAQFIEHRSRLQLQKSHFFRYKMLCRSIQRPSGAPPCMPKLAPPPVPPFLRPAMRPSIISPLIALKL